MLRSLPLAALALASTLAARPAHAHLIPARQGTVNVVGAAVYTVLSVPVSALPNVDDNHDGVVDPAELERHEAELRAEIDKRLTILDGAVPARTVRVDLLLSPDHDARGERSDQIVALKHVELGAPPTDLRVRSDLFGARESERELTITATRHPLSGTETQVGVLRPGATELALFPAAAPAPAPVATGDTSHAPRGLVALTTLCAAALALLGWSRARRPAARAT
jgi:hypothetical protein